MIQSMGGYSQVSLYSYQGCQEALLAISISPLDNPVGTIRTMALIWIDLSFRVE